MRARRRQNFGRRASEPDGLVEFDAKLDFKILAAIRTQAAAEPSRRFAFALQPTRRPGAQLVRPTLRFTMTSKSSMATYKWGPKYNASPAGFTFKDVEDTTVELNETMPPGYKFAAEPISEGGIEMIDWPGKTKGYKSIRLGIGNWPWLTDGTPSVSDVTLERRYTNLPEGQFSTFLKALDGAPSWKARELDIVKRCMADNMRVTFGRR